MKTGFFTAILSCSMIVAIAQTKYGVQASGIMSSASFNENGSDNINKNANPGFGAGVYAEISLNNKVSIKPGVNFMQKGVKITDKYTDDGTQYKQNIKANLNYVEVPVLAVYNFKGSSGKWFVGAGPSASYGLSGKLKGDLEVNDGGSSQREPFSVHAFKKENDNGADFKRFDLGLGAVAGHNVSRNMAVQLNYLHGLSNIASASSFDNDKFKNRNMMLSLKYSL